MGPVRRREPRPARLARDGGGGWARRAGPLGSWWADGRADDGWADWVPKVVNAYSFSNSSMLVSRRFRGVYLAADARRTPRATAAGAAHPATEQSARRVWGVASRQQRWPAREPGRPGSQAGARRRVSATERVRSAAAAASPPGPGREATPGMSSWPSVCRPQHSIWLVRVGTHGT